MLLEYTPKPNPLFISWSSLSFRLPILLLFLPPLHLILLSRHYLYSLIPIIHGWSERVLYKPDINLPVDTRTTAAVVGFNEEVEKHEPSDVSSHNEARANVDDSSQEAVGYANGLDLDGYGSYDKIEITEDDCYDELGFSFPTWKKWTILTIIFLVQVSMNFNTGLFSNAIGGISKGFHVSEQAARVGAAIFLICCAFGCELWAPWSEEVGRWPTCSSVYSS